MCHKWTYFSTHDPIKTSKKEKKEKQSFLNDQSPTLLNTESQYTRTNKSVGDLNADSDFGFYSKTILEMTCSWWRFLKTKGEGYSTSYETKTPKKKEEEEKKKSLTLKKSEITHHKISWKFS